jgi:hypothetical protein
MTRLLLTASVLAGALALAAGPQKTHTRDHALSGLEEAPCICKSDTDGGTRPKPHGLLLVADRDPAPPCVQGG